MCSLHGMAQATKIIANVNGTIITCIAIGIGIYLYTTHGLKSSPPLLQDTYKDEEGDLLQMGHTLELTMLKAMPQSVVLPRDTVAFKKLMNGHWARQEREVPPACFVLPRSVQEVCTAVSILKQEYDERKIKGDDKKSRALFAIRSGGHSPISSAASIKGGVLIDLSHLNGVALSEDGLSVLIGAGAKWMDVSKVLDEKGLATVGGRNSAVGVGGLTLGGGLSFFTPRFGLVCSNITSYEIVLASGSIVTASASSHADLWNALKGGSNNFGIVTSFTARCFPCTKIWSGFLYMPSFQTSKVLTAFHDSINRATSPAPNNHAAGPIACFTYIPQLGIEAVSVNLAYTAPSEREKKWPSYWMDSPFSSMFRLWSSCKTRTLTDATDEMNALNPPGRRQTFGTTTIMNDHATFIATHAVWRDGIATLRRANLKDVMFTLVLQPLLPEWARKGDATPLDLGDCESALVVVSFTINWSNAPDDEFVKSTARNAIEKIDAVAKARGTAHRYRNLNYCAEWQCPFEGYGKKNFENMKHVSRSYDPDGLFQRGCAGGFKLDVDMKAEKVRKDETPAHR